MGIHHGEHWSEGKELSLEELSLQCLWEHPVCFPSASFLPAWHTDVSTLPYFHGVSLLLEVMSLVAGAVVCRESTLLSRHVNVLQENLLEHPLQIGKRAFSRM